MALSDTELIINAQNGDSLAFEELVYRYDKMVLKIAMKYFGDPDVAKDIYQEVFIKVYKGLKSFQFKSSFSTWLFRITSNVCLTHKGNRRNMNLSLNVENDSEEENKFIANEKSSPEEQMINKDFGEKIDKALKVLSPNQKMSFLLKHYEGYKIKEIAEMMNCKEGTIKKYLFEAVRKLRVQLGEIY